MILNGFYYHHHAKSAAPEYLVLKQPLEKRNACYVSQRPMMKSLER